jgi:lipopolysaccharide/colanic/teichoic acid biosynthesis glycosyltransferase
MRRVRGPVRSIRQPPFSRPVQEQGFSGQMRRLADVVIACVLLAITSALMIIVALAIKLESAGPVLERQERIGRGGRRVQRLKFRTTVHHPEHVAPAWAQQTTQVGQFLRYTRINALPQLINVLRGEITLADLYAALLT